jgi:hypothetical protein
MSPNYSQRSTAVVAHSVQIVSFLAILSFLILIVSVQRLSAQVRADALSFQGQHLRISATLSPATIAVAYNATISASGGAAPYRFKAQNLPLGLVMNEMTGGISGLPQGAGQFQFAVWVTDSAGAHGLGTFMLTVNKPGIGIAILPRTNTVISGTTSQFQAAVTNTSNTAVTWIASSGTVSPAGLFTSPTVTISTSVMLTATSVADKTKSASVNISVIPTVIAENVSLEVLFPPTHPRQPYYTDVQTYLMHNPLVSGANLVIEWSSIDQGPGANPQYNWSTMDGAVQQWIAAGKKVNLIVWTISDGPTNTAMPQYIWNNLGPANYTTCKGQQIPNYFDSAYQIPYQQFMAEVVQHYGNNPGIGYIRFGLGRGGETNPARGLNTEVVCTNAFMKQWGWTETTWINYLNSMLNYEATLKSPKQLMLGVVATNLMRNVPQAVAATAVAAHIGFGSQGLEAGDITNYPNCTSDWCNLFNQYAGRVPLELQTIAQSDPTGISPTGSLVPLIPFGITHHASVFEIYYQDWLLAFDPAYPGYSQYGSAYAEALSLAAHTPLR